MTSIRHTAAADDDLLLAAAREAILAVGWRRTTLTDVARRAGVSRMTIYRRWQHADGLLGDLLTREWTSLLADLPAAVTPREIAAAVVSLSRRLRADPLFARVVEVDPELLLPYLVERRGRSQQALLDHLVPLLRAGQRRGLVRSGSVDGLARGLLLAVHGFVLSAPTMVDDRVSMRVLDRELGAVVERYLAP